MELHQLAVHGTVSTADAASVGLGPPELRRLMRDGTIRRLVRGWYAVADPAAPAAPWEGEDRFAEVRIWHRLRTVALLRSFDGRAAASHQSALVLHGIDVWQADLDAVHLSRTGDDHSRHRRAGVLHPAPGCATTRTEEGLLTVPPAVAVVQVGLAGPHGGGRPLASLVAADRALHDGIIAPGDLAAALALHERHAGVVGVRRLLRHADARHESVGETRLAVVMRALGYRFTPQVAIPIADGMAYADFGIDDTPVLVEFDGMAKYAGNGLTLEAEKVREDRLRRQGHEVCRFVWRDLDRPRFIGSVIDAAVERSAGRSCATRPAVGD